MLAIHTMTGGSPRLTVMLYELLSTESITAVRDQFLQLQDRITPFYQDRMRDLSPQERGVLETIATMRDTRGQPAPRKTPANIAKRMRMSQPQTSSLLARLSKDLYLRSDPNPDDKRSTVYTIREGFFDLWLAMNLSRASARRIPFLSDFFAAYYQQEEERRRKREDYWQRLKSGEFNPDAAESLSYLSTVGETHEMAAEKLKLLPSFYGAGDTDGAQVLKDEFRQLPLDSTGQWLGQRADELADTPLDEIARMIECWQARREGQLETFATRLCELGRGLDYASWSQVKIDFLRDHIEVAPLSRERVETRLNLAVRLRQLARWNEAGHQSAAAVDEAGQLKKDEILAWAFNEHALFLSHTKHLDKAESLLRRALDLTEASFGRADPKVAICLHNLAAVIHQTNRGTEAEPLMRRALAIDEASFGATHPHIAVGLNNLAMLLHDTGRLSEAEPLIRRALAIDEASFGEAHPKVALRLSNLGLLLLRTNRHSDAEPLLRRALAISEASLGDSHPRVGIELVHLAELLESTDRATEATPLRERARAIAEAHARHLAQMAEASPTTS